MAFTQNSVGSLPQSSIAITEQLIPILIIQYSWMVGTMKRILHLHRHLRRKALTPLLGYFADRNKKMKVVYL